MHAMLTALRSEALALSQHRHTIEVEDAAQVDLWGSQKELHSAFSNLVSNAVRYTPAGGRIDIRFERDAAGGAILSVRDSGYGIPAAHLPRITERFYRDIDQPFARERRYRPGAVDRQARAQPAPGGAGDRERSRTRQLFRLSFRP